MTALLFKNVNACLTLITLAGVTTAHVVHTDLWTTAPALTSGAHEPRQPEFLLAYVDPGSAGFVIVSVLGFLSAVGYTLRSAFGRLLARLRGGRRRGAAEDRPHAPDDDVPPPS